jgi:hypothetical protein
MGANLLSSFGRMLRAACDARGVSCGRWAGAFPSSANILAVGFKPKETLLYIKFRSDPPGFWGLTANRIAELDASGKPWYALLIVGSPDNGYVASQSEVRSRASSGAWTIAADGDFKVHESRDLSDISHFRSLEAFLELALPSLRGAA